MQQNRLPLQYYDEDCLVFTYFYHRVLQLTATCPMPDSCCQTEQFLMFLSHEDKLIKLYQRVKNAQTEKEEHLNKIEYLQFKVQALEKSLFEQEAHLQQQYSVKNQALIRDVIKLEEQLASAKKVQAGSKKQDKAKNRQRLQTKDVSRMLQELSLGSSIPLGVIKQQPESLFQSPMSTISLRQERPALVPLSCTNKNVQLHKSGKPDQAVDLLEKITYLQKNLHKQQKQRKVLQCENRRLRKLNEQYNGKLRRLQKLIQAREQIYDNVPLSGIEYQTTKKQIVSELENQCPLFDNN